MTTNEDVLYSVKACLREIMPSDSRVILFGSRARGDARHDSDWDILMLIDKSRVTNEDFDAYAFPLIELGWRLGADISPVLYTYKDWEKRHFTPFFHNVEEEGVEIWQ